MNVYSILVQIVKNQIYISLNSGKRLAKTNRVEMHFNDTNA